MNKDKFKYRIDGILNEFKKQGIDFEYYDMDLTELMLEKKELQTRIDKAIEYIENYKHEYYYDLVDKKEILDILRGEDNESN